MLTNNHMAKVIQLKILTTSIMHRTRTTIMTLSMQHITNSIMDRMDNQPKTNQQKDKYHHLQLPILLTLKLILNSSNHQQIKTTIQSTIMTTTSGNSIMHQTQMLLLTINSITKEPLIKPNNLLKKNRLNSNQGSDNLLTK